MAATVLVDTGFLVALLRRRDGHRPWATAQAGVFQLPWHTCEAVLAETFFLLSGSSALSQLVERGSVRVSFSFAEHQDAVLGLMRKYADAPMSLADACLVRMTEVLREPVVLTTDGYFRGYRRNGRQSVPCVLPG